MKTLVLQHVDVEHPGIFRDFLRADGIHWDTVELDRGEAIPDLDPYGLMIVMGGPQDVWQEDEHPWLVAEKQAIRRFAVELGRPFLGICLGHQLLAEAIGGRVGPARHPEVGVLTVERTAAGRADPVFANLADPLTVLQWHSAEVLDLPSAATVLARSDKCAVQAFRYGDHAYAMQFHVELTRDTVREWSVIPAYAAALDKALGAGAVTDLDRAVTSRIGRFNADARSMYDGYMATLRSFAA
ncbi:MAG: type 1 glutamine amidotransferase [Hyphomicrobiales bacterium]